MLWFCIIGLASAQTRLARPQAGPALDVAAGIGWAGRGQPVDVAGVLSFGGWAGRYDDDFAIGRHWWFGATGRVRARAARTEIAPMIEIRRGIDLLVAGVQFFVAGGVVGDVARSTEVPARALGGTVNAGLITRYRRTRHVSLLLRLEGGVDIVEGQVSPGLGAALGIGWARPGRSAWVRAGGPR